MDQVAVNKLIQELTDLEASDYDDKLMGAFQTPEEERAWRQDILMRMKFFKGSHCLDIAAGTGVLTQLIARWVGPNGHVVATDFTVRMLAKNKEKMSRSSALHRRVTFVSGDVHDPNLLDSVSYKQFDYITCRYGVHTLAEPILAFENWYKWLKSGGRVMILDAWWTRESWYGHWQQVVDLVPLSTVQNLAAVPYLLTRVGFVVEQSRLLTRVNKWYERQGTNFEPRYIIVAHKP